MKTFEEIYGELCSDYAKQTGVTLNDGGDMAIRLRVTAAQLHSLWLHAEYVRRQMFPQTAHGEYLDYHAQLRGIERTPASTASGYISFYVSEARTDSLTIPGGTCCFTDAGTEFVTTESCVIEAGSLGCSASAAAKTAGKGGNVPAGSIVNMMLAPACVTGCGNAAGFTGGADEEDDESLRARVLTSYKKLPNGANAAYYETQVLGIQGVAAAAVKPRARGLGTVDIVIAGETGVPSAETVSRVAEELGRHREICVSINVLAPETSQTDIDVLIDIKKGYLFEDVSCALTERISAYFCGELLEKPILRAKLGDIIFNTPGVENYKISLPAADIPAGEGVLPVLGALSISEMG